MSCPFPVPRGSGRRNQNSFQQPDLGQNASDWSNLLSGRLATSQMARQISLLVIALSELVEPGWQKRT